MIKNIIPARMIMVVRYSLALILITQISLGQTVLQENDSAWKFIYRATPEKIFDLIHTKLNVKFDLSKTYMYGQAWITLQPHFYEQNNIELDAKGMEIKEVALAKQPANKKLNFRYDGSIINISLEKPIKKGEKITLYIDYVAKPNELKTSGSAAITEAKGLYFINPNGKEKNKPTQIWTQGETEATSVWCPTIDKPNQKTTQEIAMTVPAKWVTLSNGILVKQQTNPDGTRTDSWKMDQPHAPYLFFMGAGEFSIIKETWRGKEVSYYVEKEYAPVARKIFGMTPEMMTFFSKITGVDYPWQKYAQIVCRDFVSGAMENTTSTLHQESAQQDARQLTDDNIWEGTIAHELFHHWFGDYVTAESWSNLTINESFANYSEALWDEYKYGKDKGDATNFSDMQKYLQSESQNKNLVRFYYKDKEDMFDNVSYNKGGCILHMLRNYVGDSAFFKSLQLFLTSNKFKPAEAHQLRIAFEEITGKDLNWFFKQWYYGSGHPNLDIQYSYDSTARKAKVLVKQLQKEQLFYHPVYIDLYFGNKRDRRQVWINNSVDSFFFDAAVKPDLINFDGGKILICTKKENKTIEQYIHQYNHAGNYVDRREAIDFVLKKQDHKLAPDFIKAALQDRYTGLKRYLVNRLDLKKKKVAEIAEPALINIIKNEQDRLIKAAAIEKLQSLKKPELKDIFLQYVTDSSYTLSGTALNAVNSLDPALGFSLSQKLVLQPMKGTLLENVATILIDSKDLASFKTILKTYQEMPLSQSKLNLTGTFAQYLGIIEDMKQFKEGIDAIISFKKEIPPSYEIDPIINNMLKGIIGAKESVKKQAGSIDLLNEQIKYIEVKMAE